MTQNTRCFSLLLLSALLTGCGGGGGGGTPITSERAALGSIAKTVVVTEENQIERLGKYAEINTTVEIGTTPKSLYLLFSNERAVSGSVTVTHNAKVISSAKKKQTTAVPSAATQPILRHAPASIQAFNARLQKSDQSTLDAKQIDTGILSRQKRNATEGDRHTFYIGLEATGTTTDATLKKVVSNVSTAFGNKTLFVWVSDDSFEGTGCTKKPYCVTQDQVDALADTFLKSGSDNDIYDWVTNIFGEEWGSAAAEKHNYLIGKSDTITILLTDIMNDNSSYGGVMGYFYAKDNYKASTFSGSNERIMFYADAVMFANDSGNGSWQREIYATLAHEFQHMIHFYQKTVKLGAEDDTWINEMLSETTEDLVATKIGHTGPRAVDPAVGSAGDPDNHWGRYPYFNLSINDLSLTEWKNTIFDYSKVSAFGAFLIRNYGGAKVLHDILYNPYGDAQAVVYAVRQTANGAGKGFGDLLREWGVGVLLSDDDQLDPDKKPVYNRGDFLINAYGGSTYEIGSINFFNYTPQPSIETNAATVPYHGNYYYQIGENLSGNVTISVTVDQGVEATLIAK